METQNQNLEVNIGETSNNSTPQSINPTPKKSNKLLVIGLILLAVVSISVTMYLLLRSSSPTSQELPVIDSTPVPSSQPLTLELTSPADGELSVNREILVKGKSLPQITVVIFTEFDETTVESDVNGLFEGTIVLADGINSLTATAFDENGEEKSLTLDIVYDSEA